MDFMLILWTFLVSVPFCFCVDYKVAYFDQIIDHFNFQSFGSQTYKQRYFYNDTWWEKGRGPIFFYAGNELPLESGWEKNGYIMEIAPSHKALLLFVEHRYYGESMPFGKDSFEDFAIGLLSIEQALADYATLLTAFREENNAENCPVIAFGVSYGGMLTAYMRFKYPNVIQGSIASSAPVYQTAGFTSRDLFYQSTTQSFRNVSINCERQVRDAFWQLDRWSQKGAKGLRKISREMQLCRQLQSRDDYVQLLTWLRGAFVSAAQNNFPYPVDEFPAFPVMEMCERLLAEKDYPVSGLRSACGVPYNGTGETKCFDVITSEHSFYGDPSYYQDVGLNVIAWDYQVCTEVNIEGGSNGVTDMFPVLPYTPSMKDEYCRDTWKVKPRREWLAIQYWANDMTSSSNIVFSNGNLDPWAPGGVQSDISDTIVAIMIEDASHHLDLRASNPADPQSVRDARDFEVRHINKWIENFYKDRKLTTVQIK